MAIQIIGRTGMIAGVDANTRAALTRAQPVNNGALGNFRWSGQTGVVALGAQTDSPWFSFRWAETTRWAVVRHIRVGLQSGPNAFGADSAVIDAIVARGFVTNDTGGTVVTPIIGNSQKKMSRLGSTALFDMRIASNSVLGAGTRVLDLAPMGSIAFPLNTLANAAQLSKDENSRIFDMTVGQGMWPVILHFNEGVIVRITIPGGAASGSWTAFIDMEWNEIIAFP